MRSIRMTSIAPETEPEEVFELLCDFERYPDLCPTVLEVTVDEDVTPIQSSWTVRFRDGLMMWTETDEVDEERLEVRFEQIDGDFEELSGGWRVLPRGDGGAEIEFTSEFDVGIPSIGDVVNPLAERTLYDNSAELLRGLLGESARITSPPPHLPDFGRRLRERVEASW